MRDRRLDFWRGLCLIDMVLVHLLHEGIDFGILRDAVVDYTRFAAGGFVFTAGLGVGLVVLRRIGTTRSPGDATGLLIRRALYLLGVHYALTGSIIAMDVATGVRPPAPDVSRLVLDIVMLREAPEYVDILPLYAVMLMATPLVSLLIRRGAWPVVAAMSAALFAYGLRHPAALSPRGIVEFPFLLWQAFFVAGLLFSMLLPSLDRHPRAWAAVTAVAWLAFVGTSLLAYGPRFGWLEADLVLSFRKAPLTLGEFARYLAATLVVISTSTQLWRWIGESACARFVCTLGRRSLAVYVTHIFIQEIVVRITGEWWWLGGAHALVAIPAIVLLWALACGLDVWTAGERPWRRMRYALRGWGAPPAGVLAAAALIAITSPLVAPLERSDDGGEPASVEIAAELVFDGGFTAEDLFSPAIDFVESGSDAGEETLDEIEIEDDGGADEPLRSGIGSAAPRWT